jgi:hypothetical protein
MQQKVLDEGDYFGVRAIEKGYYGGVAQSPPASGGNSPLMPPQWTVIDSNRSLIPLSPRCGSDVPESSISGRTASQAQASTDSLKTNASTITRPQPSNAELTGRRNHDPAIAMSTYVPTSPASPLKLESSIVPKQNPETVQRVSAPPSKRPALNRQVQSYAQWRLSADLRRITCAVSRSGNKASGLRAEDRSIDNTYMHSETDRHRSCSASSVEERTQLRSLRGKLYAQEAAGSSDYLNQPSPSACNSSNDYTQQSSPRSQDAECGYNHSPTGATRSIKRTRDSLRRTKKFPAEPMAQERRSRQLNITLHNPSIYHCSDSGCALTRIIELDNPLSSNTEERGDPKRESSSDSSISGSSTRSRSSSDATSVSSIKSMTESLEDVSETMSKESCKLCRRKSDSQRTNSAAIQPIATLSI